MRGKRLDHDRGSGRKWSIKSGSAKSQDLQVTLDAGSGGRSMLLPS